MNEYQVPANTLCSQVQGSQGAKDQRQELNTALAQLAAAGNTVALGQLWEINKPILHRMFWQWYNRNQSIAEAAGVTLEDLDQEGYLAIKEAADRYDPSKGSFLTILGYTVLHRISRNTCGRSGRYIITEDGRRVRVSADAMHRAASLDESVNEDDGGTTLGDLQADPAAEAEMQEAENRIYREQLHEALEEALGKLSERERLVIEGRYFEGKTLKQLASDHGVNSERIRQIEWKALVRLRRNPALIRWYGRTLQERAWHGTGFMAWKSGGSVAERAIEYLERKGAYILEVASQNQ